MITTKEDNIMKRQIRRGVFETNSSSTHSMTMMMKSDYEKWHNENLYLFDGWTFGWAKEDAPKEKMLYTKDEAIAFMKKNRYYKDADSIDDEMLREEKFISSDDEGSDYFESFYEEFTTPSGETVVAFGEYGYDG
jgi:hypothetical protein